MVGYGDNAAAQSYYEQDQDNSNNDIFGPGVAYSELDSALLVYSEAGGRVQAVEPTANLAIH